MLGPNSMLALLIVAAAPSASTDQARGATRPPRVQTAVTDQDAPAAIVATQFNSPPEGRDQPMGTAFAGDSEPPVRRARSVRQALLREGSPFEEEPTPIPPGEEPVPGIPSPLDRQPTTPAYEVPPLEPGMPEPETPQTEPLPEGPLPGELLTEDQFDDDDYPGECPCGDCAGRGSSRRCAEGATCDGRCGRSSGRTFWGFDLDGWVSQGVTINTDSPADRSNFPVTFNDRSNDYQMNQLYLRLTRAVKEGGHRWDVGGRVDLLYGTDSVFTFARGLEVRGDLSSKWNSQRYGLAMPQAYMEVYAPWGNGLSMKLGHFYSILGYETVPAIDNFFYSKSLSLQYGEPFTHTGFLGSTRLGILNFHAGMTRGWDNWEDNNNDFDFLGGVDWTSPSKCTSVALAVSAGRQQDEPPVNTDLRTIFSLVVQHRLSERWQYVGQYDHAFDEGAAADGGDADWFGVNQYLYYTINPCWKAALRGEWFRDEDATRIDTNTGADYYELTLGLNWTPSELITVRPEFRWDWAAPLGGRALPAGHRDDQILLALDIVLRL